jgi:uncharacterized protein YcbX
MSVMPISLVLQYRNTIILPVQIHPKAHDKIKQVRTNLVNFTTKIFFESSSQTISFVRITSQKMLNFLQK